MHKINMFERPTLSKEGATLKIGRLSKGRNPWKEETYNTVPRRSKKEGKEGPFAGGRDWDEDAGVHILRRKEELL